MSKAIHADPGVVCVCLSNQIDGTEWHLSESDDTDTRYARSGELKTGNYDFYIAKDSVLTIYNKLCSKRVRVDHSEVERQMPPPIYQFVIYQDTYL